MKHPGPLLADYLDGTLAPTERAAVDAHLASCAACREEVRLARAGHELAAGLPEPAAPPGLGDAAVEEARRIAAERSPEVAALEGARPRPRPTSARWVAVAGAAAVVVLIAVAAPRIGQPGAQPQSAAGAATAISFPKATTVEVQHANVTFDSLGSAAQALRSSAGGAAGAAAPEASAGQPPVAMPTADGSMKSVPERLPAATQCLEQAFPDEATGTLTRVVLARYEGRPAYFGLFAVGPGAGLPPTQLLLLVASVHGCDLLAQHSIRL